MPRTAYARTTTIIIFCGVVVARSVNVTALNDYVAAGYFHTSANARSPTIAGSIERTVSLDGQCLALWDMDGWIFHLESLDGIRSFEDYSSIAHTVDASPIATAYVYSVDGYIFNVNYSTIGNGNLIVAAQRTCQGFCMCCRVISCERREIGCFSRFGQCWFHHNRV